jgi:hypothetical protein
LGNNADQEDTANATTRYSWNITGFTVTNENEILFQYKNVNDILFTTILLPLNTPSIQGVLDVLNSLNLGSFFITTSGGNTFINNYNNNLAFNQLDIYDSATPQLIYDISTTSIGGVTNVDVNFVNQLSITNPVSVGGSIPIVNGDVVDFYGTTDIGGQIRVSVYNVTTSTYLYIINTNTPLDPFSFTFTALSGNTYLLEVKYLP